MRRRLAFTAVFQRLSFISFTLFLFQTTASRATQGCRGRASIAEVFLPWPLVHAFKRFALCFQIGLRVVVGGVEADVAEPASDHRDIDACRNQMPLSAKSLGDSRQAELRVVIVLWLSYSSGRRCAVASWSTQSSSV